MNTTWGRIHFFWGFSEVFSEFMATYAWIPCLDLRELVSLVSYNLASFSYIWSGNFSPFVFFFFAILEVGFWEIWHKLKRIEYVFKNLETPECYMNTNCILVNFFSIIAAKTGNLKNGMNLSLHFGKFYAQVYTPDNNCGYLWLGKICIRFIT